jgi:hypothetical protein
VPTSIPWLIQSRRHARYVATWRRERCFSRVRPCREKRAKYTHAPEAWYILSCAWVPGIMYYGIRDDSRRRVSLWTCFSIYVMYLPFPLSLPPFHSSTPFDLQISCQFDRQRGPFQTSFASNFILSCSIFQPPCCLYTAAPPPTSS